MCILIFAFRGCYYLAHLYCKICFKSQSILQNFPWTSFLHDVLWRRARSDFNCLQTVGRFLSRVSDYLSSYVFLLRRRSFATRKVYISLETLLCLSQLSDRTYVSRAPAIYSSFLSVCHHINRSPPCLFCVYDIHRTRNYGFTRSTQPITAHERTAIYKSQLEAIIRKPYNTQGVGTSFWSLICRRTIPGFSFVCNAG